MRKAERWFLQELKLLDREVYPFFFNRYHKWMIIRDFPRRLAGLTDYDPVSGKNFIVEIVIEDKEHNPLPLDRRVLEAIRRSLYYKNSTPLHYYLDQIDEEEEAKARRASAETRLRMRDAGRTSHKMMTSKTFT